MKKATLLTLTAIVAGTCAADPEPISLADRMQWWEEARFGMFVHWGIYSVPAGFYKGEPTIWSAEWMMEKGQIPIAEYETYAAQFNPVDFDADALASLARQAGMKYLVVTAKHHDGFSMFASKASPYNVAEATPFKRDVMKELAEACAKQGLRFGFYYSQAQDWHHPGGLGNTWDTTLERVSSDEYVYKKALPEVEQLLTEYGPIAIFWWDTPREMSDEVIERLHTITTELQPAIITNDRLGEGYPGHHKTFEREPPRRRPEARYWELCQPISRSWGYRSDDHDFKPAHTLIRNLSDSCSKGGNYLLNVSPTAAGPIRQEAVDRLTAVGKWMAVNSESVYGTQASPCAEIPEWGRITLKTAAGKIFLYLHVFEWQEGAALTVPVENEVRAAVLLADPQRPVTAASTDEGITVRLAGSAPDDAVSVIRLELTEAPNALPEPPLGQDEQGTVLLPAYRAQFENLQGPGAAYHEKHDAVDEWESATAKVYWNFQIEKPGTFDIIALAAARQQSAVIVTAGGESRTVRIAAQDKDQRGYQPLHLGQITITEPGSQTLSLMPDAARWNPIRLREVRLTTVSP